MYSTTPWFWWDKKLGKQHIKVSILYFPGPGPCVQPAYDPVWHSEDEGAPGRPWNADRSHVQVQNNAHLSKHFLIA